MSVIDTACMGGWCASREKCARYYADGVARTRPAERMCWIGATDQFIPLESSRMDAAMMDELMVRVFGATDTLGETV